MKIGILTFHRAYNYGALLQCYALKEYLSSLGHEVSIIDYWPEYHSNTYRLIPNFSNLKFKSKIKALFLLIIGINRIKKRNNGYIEFINNKLGLDKSVKYTNPIELGNIGLDIVIYGSDQIWWNSNLPSFKGFDLVYWGQFINSSVKKITYAPSMGVMSHNEEELNQIKDNLSNFSKISVRESATKDFLKNKFNIDSELVLDPVFLLDKNRWDDLCSSRHSTVTKNENYILFYHLMRNDDALILVNKLALKHNCKVIEIRGRVDSLKFGNRYKQTEDPIGFLQLIRNAKFVVSTSFHGVAFSVIFEKQFLAIGMGKNSERAKSLLKNLGIENRYMSNLEALNLNEFIDYNQVNIKLNTLKTISINFLIDNI